MPGLALFATVRSPTTASTGTRSPSVRPWKACRSVRADQRRRQSRRRRLTMEEPSRRRVAVVTGGAGAIGGAIVQPLAKGDDVVILGDEGDFHVDLAEPDQVRRTAQAVLARHGRLDGFVDAAARVAFAALEDF